jgi:parallel beta-helix repeat protein
MALLGLDRLAKKDMFTAELWNSLVDILEAKFSSGISESDISWPLLAQGDIDFQQTYTIVGLRTFWNIVNAAEYASLDAAVTAAEATGGGAVFIPPYTTISASNVSIDASNVAIYGCGPTSVIKITAASTGPLITTGSSGLSDISISNLMLDGTGGGAGCKGVVAKRITRFRMRQVYMTGFTDDFVYLTNGGVAGQSCVDAVLDELHCSGGSDNHIAADDIAGLTINKLVSKSATGDAVSMVPVGSSNLIQDVLIANSRISGGGAKGIRIVGSGAAGIDAHSRIRIKSTSVYSMTGTPFELGATSLLLKDTSIVGCEAPVAVGDALRIATNKGVVGDCMFANAGSDGIDLTNSVDLLVQNNHCQDAAVNGINATSSTDCTLMGNNVRDAVTAGVLRTSATGLRCHGNPGDIGSAAATSVYDITGYTRAFGSGAGDMGWLYTIPANTVRDGDIVDVFARITGGSGTCVIELRAAGTGVGSVNIAVLGGGHIHWRFYAKQGSAGRVLTTAVGPATTTQLNTASPTIDWTASVALTIFATVLTGVDVTLQTTDVMFDGGR